VALTATASGLAAESGSIAGQVVNGTDGGKPLAGAEVVLRAGGSGGFAPIASTTTDQHGRFEFGNLSLDEGVIFLPGANRDEVHFPGPRVRLDHQHPNADVELVAYDAVASPSPLVVRRHCIAVHVATGYLEITEALTIENPSVTAYVGETQEDHPTITLRISLPAGFETVTFAEEFLGRNFLIHNDRLVTDLPWPPGQRELSFVYRLPVEQRSRIFRRVLDLPTDQMIVRVTGQDPRHVACDLPVSPSRRDGEIVFAHQGTTLASGHAVEVRMGELPIRWEAYARWTTLGVLGLALAWMILRRRWPRRGVTSSLPTRRTRGNGRRERQSLPVGRSP